MLYIDFKTLTRTEETRFDHVFTTLITFLGFIEIKDGKYMWAISSDNSDDLEQCGWQKFDQFQRNQQRQRRNVEKWGPHWGNNGNFQEFHESWLQVIDKSPVEIVKEAALAVYQFFMARETRSEKQWQA